MNLDQPQPIREHLDLTSLDPYLRKKLPELSGNIKIEQFPSGFSNLTYLISDEVDHEYVLRRPPFGANIKGGHDMKREYRILHALSKHQLNVPEPLDLCTDDSVLGADFYIMRRIKGIVLRHGSTGTSEAFFSSLSHNAISTLIELHRLNPNEIELSDLGNPEGYVARQINGWTRRYARAKTEDLPGMELLCDWLFKNMPSEQGVSLIHNDYKYDNLILDPENFSIRAILDWEMATIGCPMMDLGAALGYWIDQDDDPRLKKLSFSLTHHSGNLTRQQVAEMYAQAQNHKEDNLLFYGVYGIWRIVVILQQIYARYLAGHTQDSRFASLGSGIKVLIQHAQTLLARGHL
ncbi:MAG: phosphotransferase family protein [Proteobacteria bacterium]|nr:phosphotransferase family protein [Pseudomonadota bacterium]